MRFFLFIIALLLPAFPYADQSETDGKKAYEFLVAKFDEQDFKTKAQVLRELALLKEEMAIAFLTRVSADYSENSETRREALKGLVAALPGFGPHVEANLRRSKIAVSPTLQALREYKDPMFAEGLAMLLLHASEEDLKEYLPTFLFLWDGKTLPKSFTPENAEALQKRLSFFKEFLSKERKKKLQSLLVKLIPRSP